MDVPTKWTDAGAQVILKSDFVALWLSTLKVLIDEVTSATPTPAVGISGAPIQYNLSALGSAAVFGAPTGTPVDGQLLTLRIKDNGTIRALSFASGAGAYIARGEALPTTTVANKYLYVWFIYNTAAERWDCIDKKQEA